MKKIQKASLVAYNLLPSTELLSPFQKSELKDASRLKFIVRTGEMIVYVYNLVYTPL